MGEMRNACNILDGKPEEKRPLVRPRRRWADDNIKDLGETELEGVDRMHLTQDRV